MNLHFRAKDHLTINLLLLCVLASIGIRYLVVSGTPFRTENLAVEFDDQSQKDYRFELDVNTASWSELTLLPGIGDRLAHRIVDYREKNGRVRQLEELIEVEGIGPKKMKAVKEFLRVGSQTVDPEKQNGV